MNGDYRFQFDVHIGPNPADSLWLEVSWNGAGRLTSIQFIASGPIPEQQTLLPDGISSVVDRLRAYFESGRPLGELEWQWIEMTDWTEFRRKVYRAICDIPHGETRTYGWVAARLGSCSATRAVGQALRNNPIPILVPCHRVVAANSLGGFMGSADPEQLQLQLKQKLISLEEQYLSPFFSFLLSTDRRIA